jgi:hypothetical protein
LRDCDDGPTGTNNPTLAFQCAAVTQVLAYFTNPSIGGTNAKATQENGMTAARDALDLGTNGIRWLAAATPDAGPPPPSPVKSMSGMLGGLQFSHPFSSTAGKWGWTSDFIQAEGCPSYSQPCTGLTPGQGLENVLSLSFFEGTAAGPSYCTATPLLNECGSTIVDYGNFKYSHAPLNFVQIYDVDVLYASGLAMPPCTLIDITGRIGSSGVGPIAPNVIGCEVTPSDPSYTDVQATQKELNRAGQSLFGIAKPVAF